MAVASSASILLLPQSTQRVIYTPLLEEFPPRHRFTGVLQQWHTFRVRLVCSSHSRLRLFHTISAIYLHPHAQRIARPDGVEPPGEQ